jgi:hypothetical protein
MAMSRIQENAGRTAARAAPITAPQRSGVGTRRTLFCVFVRFPGSEGGRDGPSPSIRRPSPLRRGTLLALAAVLGLAGPALAAEQAARIPLWPDTAPGSTPGPEQARIVERSDDQALPDRAISGRYQPYLVVYRPKTPNGSALLVAPGGCYWSPPPATAAARTPPPPIGCCSSASAIPRTPARHHPSRYQPQRRAPTATTWPPARVGREVCASFFFEIFILLIVFRAVKKYYAC